MHSATRIGWLAIMALLVTTVQLQHSYSHNNLSVGVSRLRVQFIYPKAKVGVKEAIGLHTSVPTTISVVKQHLYDSPHLPIRVHQISATRFSLSPKTIWPADAHVILGFRPGTHEATLVTDDHRELRIDLATQTLFALKRHRIIRVLSVSTGSPPDWTTPTGTFWIYKKVEDDHMVGGKGSIHWDVQHVPYAQYFTGAVALHGAWWNHTFDRPVSHGCIQVPTAHGPKGPTGDPPDAEWLWHFTDVGTPVIVYGKTPEPPATNPLPYPPSARALTVSKSSAS